MLLCTESGVSVMPDEGPWDGIDDDCFLGQSYLMTYQVVNGKMLGLMQEIEFAIFPGNGSVMATGLADAAYYTSALCAVHCLKDEGPSRLGESLLLDLGDKESWKRYCYLINVPPANIASREVLCRSVVYVALISALTRRVPKATVGISSA